MIMGAPIRTGPSGKMMWWWKGSRVAKVAMSRMADQTSADGSGRSIVARQSTR
jgi:hypothetical protein